MSQQTKYEIVFDNNPRGVYFSGQTVSGTLTISPPVEKVMKNITLWVCGRARINKRPGNIPQRDYPIFQESFILLRRDDNQLVYLERGEYKYKFEAKLPKIASQSFYSNYGFVHYEVIVMFVECYSNDTMFKKSFTVIQAPDRSLDINSAQMKRPFEADQTNNICYCCCLYSEPFHINVKATSQSLKPGQMFYAYFHCNTKTNEKVYKAEISLMQQVEYNYINGEKFAYKTKIAENQCSGENVKKYFGKDFVIGLEIPVTQSTDIPDIRKTIVISYYMDLKIELLTFCDDDFKFDLPVTIYNDNHNFYTAVKNHPNLPSNVGILTQQSPAIPTRLPTIPQLQPPPIMTDLHKLERFDNSRTNSLQFPGYVAPSQGQLFIQGSQGGNISTVLHGNQSTKSSVPSYPIYPPESNIFPPPQVAMPQPYSTTSFGQNTGLSLYGPGQIMAMPVKNENLNINTSTTNMPSFNQSNTLPYPTGNQIETQSFPTPSAPLVRDSTGLFSSPGGEIPSNTENRTVYGKEALNSSKKLDESKTTNSKIDETIKTKNSSYEVKVGSLTFSMGNDNRSHQFQGDNKSIELPQNNNEMRATLSHFEKSDDIPTSFNNKNNIESPYLTPIEKDMSILGDMLEEEKSKAPNDTTETSANRGRSKMMQPRKKKT